MFREWLRRWLRRWFRPKPEPEESKLLGAINAELARHGKGPLKRSTCLDGQSLAHLKWLAKRNSLWARVVRLVRAEIAADEHAGFKLRLAACGHDTGAENVAWGQKSAEEVVADWMSSPAHRANLLGDWDVCGTAEHRGYWCAIFARG